MSEHAIRDLSSSEKLVVSRFAQHLPEAERTKLMADLSKATAESLARDSSRVLFHIAGYDRPAPVHGQRPVGAEGAVTDRDGTTICVLLHVDSSNRLYELELIREGLGKILEPDWRSLKVF
jgi:hypothetical protein